MSQKSWSRDNSYLKYALTILFAGTNSDCQVSILRIRGGLWYAGGLRRPHDPSRQLGSRRHESIQIGHVRVQPALFFPLP